MNVNNVGRTIAIINGGKYRDKLVNVDDSKLPTDPRDDEQDLFDYKEFSALKLSDGTFSQYPNLETGSNGKNKRDVLYICGASGSGKSYYTKSFCLNYLKAYPKNNIYIFSQLTEDDSLKDLGKKLLRIKIDETIVTEPFTYTDFKDSLVIFDDIDALKNKIIKKSIMQLKEEMLSLGRHEAITVIVTSHQSCKGHESKDQILESTSCTFFLQSGTNYNTLLKTYMGFNDKEIRRLKKIPSRWITVFKQSPQIIMTERQILLKADFEDEKLGT